MYSLQEVFKAAGVPVDFEPYFLSEINPVLSAKLEDVVSSISKNKICIKVFFLLFNFVKYLIYGILNLRESLLHPTTLQKESSKH